MSEKLTKGQWDELDALREANDATGKPSFLLRSHWYLSGYRELVRAGLVKWGQPPYPFQPSKWAGASITPVGRKALSEQSP